MNEELWRKKSVKYAGNCPATNKYGNTYKVLYTDRAWLYIEGLNIVCD